MQPNRLSLPRMHSSLVHYCYLFKPLDNYLIDYMVAKSSHILYILFWDDWDDWDDWVKYLCFGVMGKNIIYYPRMYVNLKSTPSILIILIRVIRIVNSLL